MSDIVEAWKWQSPGEIIGRLLSESARIARRGEAISVRPTDPGVTRDRYYTQAKRLRIRQLMREGNR